MFESLRMTARSITFCSSRMFPGHPSVWTLNPRSKGDVSDDRNRKPQRRPSGSQQGQRAGTVRGDDQPEEVGGRRMSDLSDSCPVCHSARSACRVFPTFRRSLLVTKSSKSLVADFRRNLRNAGPSRDPKSLCLLRQLSGVQKVSKEDSKASVST